MCSDLVVNLTGLGLGFRVDDGDSTSNRSLYVVILRIMPGLILCVFVAVDERVKGGTGWKSVH